MRCKAASTSPITARRPSSDLRMLRFVVVERFEPRLGGGDLGLEIARARGGVDQFLIELAPVGADLLDLALERGLGVGGFALGVAGVLEFLVALLEVGRNRGLRRLPCPAPQ